MKLRSWFWVGALTLLVFTACSGSDDEAAPEPTATPAAEAETPSNTDADTQNINTEETMITTASGLQYEILNEGTGQSPQVGDIVAVHYIGTLEDGTKFDSSVDRGEPIRFPLGQGRVIRGWDEGIALLKVGSKARFIIPPNLAYGSRSPGAGIPANATLIFEVELVDILAGAPAAPTEVKEADYTTTESGLKYYDFEVGEGETPTAGSQVIVHYTGWLMDNGQKFDSSLDRGEPAAFPIGVGRVIPGWDEGVITMKVGGKRQLVIPGDLGYGTSGFRNVIPPNATLIFEIELLEIQ